MLGRCFPAPASLGSWERLQGCVTEAKQADATALDIHDQKVGR